MFKAVEGAEDSMEHGADELKRLTVDSRDTVVGIAASGRTPFVVGTLKAAAAADALTACVACVRNSLIGQYAKHPIEIETGAEVIMGSTRLRAGTATKLVSIFN